jgi:hypothetical protein
MKDNLDKYRGYIITGMEIGDTLDNIIFMYDEPPLKLKHQNDIEIKEGTDL